MHIQTQMIPCLARKWPTELHSAEQWRKDCWIVNVSFRSVWEGAVILERTINGQKSRYIIEQQTKTSTNVFFKIFLCLLKLTWASKIHQELNIALISVVCRAGIYHTTKAAEVGVLNFDCVLIPTHKPLGHIIIIISIICKFQLWMGVYRVGLLVPHPISSLEAQAFSVGVAFC